MDIEYIHLAVHYTLEDALRRSMSEASSLHPGPGIWNLAVQSQIDLEALILALEQPKSGPPEALKATTDVVDDSCFVPSVKTQLMRTILLNNNFVLLEQEITKGTFTLEEIAYLKDRMKPPEGI